MFFELVGCIHRYHAALFRPVYVGDPPDAVVTAAEASMETLQVAKDFIRPGVACGDVQALIQDNLTSRLGKFGLKRHLGRTGYSIGIAFPPDWGEGQIISFFMDDPRPLQAGMTFHLIPAAKLSDHGSFNTSDTIVVTEDGCESLTNFPRKLYAR
jgi:Xaa-Pro dipeptidase